MNWGCVVRMVVNLYCSMRNAGFSDHRNAFPTVISSDFRMGKQRDDDHEETHPTLPFVLDSDLDLIQKKAKINHPDTEQC